MAGLLQQLQTAVQAQGATPVVAVISEISAHAVTLRTPSGPLRIARQDLAGAPVIGGRVSLSAGLARVISVQAEMYLA